MIALHLKNFLKCTAISCISAKLVQNIALHFHRRQVLVLMYHGVSRDSDPFESFTILPKSLFRNQMEILKENFDCLTIDQCAQDLEKTRQRPGAVVTFDDGYANNLEIALPILEELEIPAVIYITTRHALERQLFWPDKIWMAAKLSKCTLLDLSEIPGLTGQFTLNGSKEPWQQKILRIIENLKYIAPSEREIILDNVLDKLLPSHQTQPTRLQVENNAFTPLTSQDITKLASHPLITIGAHSHCHNLLDQIPLTQALESISTSKKILQELTGKTVNHFSYPNGNFDKDLKRGVQKAGFTTAVSVSPGFYKNGDDPFAIPRMGIYGTPSIESFKATTIGIEN